VGGAAVVVSGVRGATVGRAVAAVGATVGTPLGATVDTAVGAGVGTAVGATVGAAVGATVGAAVSAAVDTAVGATIAAVAALVGRGVAACAVGTGAWLGSVDGGAVAGGAGLKLRSADAVARATIFASSGRRAGRGLRTIGGAVGTAVSVAGLRDVGCGAAVGDARCSAAGWDGCGAAFSDAGCNGVGVVAETSRGARRSGRSRVIAMLSSLRASVDEPAADESARTMKNAPTVRCTTIESR